MSAGTSEFFCLICLLVCSCTAQKNITAKHGQDAILPCKVPNINNISDINKITAEEWIRPGLDPEYVLLYRDGRFDPDSQHPSYENRVDLEDKEMKDGDFYLILKNVTMEDTGKYVCRVSQKGKTEPFSIIYLKVYLSAQKKITAERGQDVVLPCKVPNVNNISDITAGGWRRPGLDPEYVLLYRNRSLNPDNRHESYQNRVVLQDKEMKDGDFSLILKNVKMEDTGTYECHVDQSGKNDLISIINLEVHPPAQEIITAERGQDVVLPCKAPDNKITAGGWRRPGLDPDYVLLYRGGRLDPDNQHPSYQNRVDLQDEEMKDGDFSLILKNVTMEDTGRFECHVDQSGKAELISRIILVVVEPDYSWIIGLAVGLPLGVLVCLLSAAAVFLNRQNRKRKTLENEKPEEVELM